MLVSVLLIIGVFALVKGWKSKRICGCQQCAVFKHIIENETSKSKE